MLQHKNILTPACLVVSGRSGEAPEDSGRKRDWRLRQGLGSLQRLVRPVPISGFRLNPVASVDSDFHDFYNHFLNTHFVPDIEVDRYKKMCYSSFSSSLFSWGARLTESLSSRHVILNGVISLLGNFNFFF